MIPVMLLAFLAGAVLASEDESDQMLGVDSQIPGKLRRFDHPLEKPAKFESFEERLDFIQHNFHYTMQSHADRVDDLLAGTNRTGRLESPLIRIRITPYFKFEQDGGLDVSFDPDLKLSVHFPNTRRRLTLFINSGGQDNLPGVDPIETDERAQVGVRRERRYFRTDVGVKARWPPIFFTRIEWVPNWSFRRTVFRPRQRFFYESDDGWGSLSSITLHRWFGRNRDQFWQTDSAVKSTTRTTEGRELEQSIRLGLVRTAIQPDWTWRRVMGTSDIARGHVLRYSVFGHVDSDESIVDRHRLTYTYRRPIYKYWMYLEVAPGLEAKNDDDWKVIPSITVGIDMLFWGFYDR